MMSTLRSVWIWLVTLTMMLVWLPVIALVRLFERDPRGLRTARWFRSMGPVLGKLGLWEIHVFGHENMRPGQVYVVVSNHQSFTDIPLLAHIRLDTKWLSKAELFRVPLLGWMMSLAGDVSVERGERRKSAQALLECAQYLRDGVSVVFFPEGTRSRDGGILPFNDGPFKLAIREQRSVLPVVLEGSGASLPRDSWMFTAQRNLFVSVLPPVGVEGRDLKQSAELREEVREKMVEELARLRGAPLGTRVAS